MVDDRRPSRSRCRAVGVAIHPRFDGLLSQVYNQLAVGGSIPPVRAFLARTGTLSNTLDWFSPKEPAA